MEKLFEAGSGDFTVYGEYSIWQHCSPQHDSTSYQNLYDVELVFRGLLSQVNCRDVIYDDMPKSIDDILTGKFKLHEGSTKVSVDGTITNKKKKHRYLFWLLLLGGIYAGYRIHKNGNRVPQSWIQMAYLAKELVAGLVTNLLAKIRFGVHQYHSPGRTSEAEMETMDFGRPKSTSLSGGII
jgi:hypothetical protein